MELDAVLGRGFPRGSLVELYGPASSGRTSLAFSLLAEATESSRRARSLMSPILLTRCPSRLRAWTFRGCFGFDAEKPGTEDRMSKRLGTLLEWAKKRSEEHTS